MNNLAVSIFKKIKRSIFFVTVVMFNAAILNVTAQQQKRYIIYDVKNGLSQNSVHAITRDRDGLVWIGTQDGLNSFDGTNFTVYKHNSEDSNSISDQFVLSIKEDLTGNLWVGTRNGLNYFNKRTKKFTRIYLNENEQHSFQASYDKFYIQNDNKIVIKNQGLHLFDPLTGKKTLLQAHNGDVIDWLILPNYNTWLFSSSKGVVFYPNIKKPNYVNCPKPTINLSPDNGYCSSHSINDSIYCLYDFNRAKKIFFFNTKSGKIVGQLSYPSTAMELAYSNNKLILCTTTGLYEKPANLNNDWVLIAPNNGEGLPPGGFLSAYFDNEGNSWLGSAGSGLAVNNPRFNFFTTISTPIPNDKISGITFSGSDLFVGTHTGLYSIKNFKNTSQQKFNSVLKNVNISSITSNKEGNIWLAVNNDQLYLINNSGNILNKIKLPERQYKSYILNLTIDNTNRLLVTTTYGVFIVDAPQKNNIIKIDTAINKYLLSQYYMSSYQDRENKIWLAGNLGVDIINPSTNSYLYFNSNTDTQSFLKKTIITSITQDMDGAIWIATIRNGVYKYHNNRYTHYTHTSGLSSDIAYNLICDNKNRIWVTTSSGLNIFDKSENAFKSIAAFDGVSKTSFAFGSFLKHNEYIIIGGNGNLLVCMADKYVIKKENLHAFISDVKVNGKSVDIVNNGFSIMPDDKLIRFEFAYSPAFYGGTVVYQYRLRGTEKNWTNLSSGSNSITYTGFPYKTLYMEVRAAGSNSNLNKAAVFSLQIKSFAPFYKTPLFIIAIIITLIFLISLLTVYYNKQKYKKQLAALQVEKELQKERVRIGRDLHDNLGAYTSALIAGLSRIKSTDINDVQNITDLKDYGANIMGLLRETIWMLNAAELTVTSFCDRFINYAMRMNKNYPAIDCSFKEEIENDKTLQPTIMLNLFRILQEALQNACKHSEAKNIQFTVSSKKILEFTITDNGRGFIGKGKEENYGITNMKQRASEAGYTCNITSNKQGTTVSITENTADV